MWRRSGNIISGPQQQQQPAWSTYTYPAMSPIQSTRCWMPTPRTSAGSSMRAVPQFRTIMLGLRNGSVLVHCAAGISRSATLVIAYLMKTRNIGFKEAITFVRVNRNVRPNLGFERQLKQYQREINEVGEGKIFLKNTITEKLAQRRTSYNRGSNLPGGSNEYLKFEPRTAEEHSRRKAEQVRRIPFPHSQSRPRERKNFKVRPIGKQSFFVVGFAQGGKDSIHSSIGGSDIIKAPIIQNHHKNALNNGWLKFQPSKKPY